MKKLIVKTALITLGAAILLGALLLVILSFSAPKVMMDLTASMGMESVSGNYAYGEWERSGDIDCLARSFLIAAKHDDETASQRFDVLYREEGFSAYCEAGAPKDEALEGELPGYSYRDYLTGTAARVKYRLSKTDEEKEAAIGFALSETDKSFPEGNPFIALTAEALKGDGDAALLLSSLREGGVEHNEQYQAIEEILESKANA